MTTNFIVQAYLIYLPIALFMTFWVAKVLFKNASVFMTDIFHGKEDIAQATNKLFEIGFYLMNIGTALFILHINEVASNQELIEKLSLKIGGFSIYLGLMLFANLFMFFRGRKKAKINHLVNAS